MKRVSLIIAILFTALSLHAQTVENIRVAQDGENLNITYRIGASTASQIFNVYLTCSMNGSRRFEPKAVIGDVGGNIVGGKSFYTIVWDVFEDVDEVVNPEFFIRVELVSDAAAETVTRSQTQQKPVQEPVQKQQETTKQPEVSEQKAEVKETKEVSRFERNGFFSYNGITGFGIPIGISFGSLNNWGYYVTPLRMGIHPFDWYDWYYDTWESDANLTFMVTAGVTKHFVSAGFYRLHGYWGLGGHLNAESLVNDPYASGHVVLETGIVNVLGGFNITVGLEYSAGYNTGYSEYSDVYKSPTHFVFGAGFVF
jgi:hypothetical protein